MIHFNDLHVFDACDQKALEFLIYSSLGLKDNVKLNLFQAMHKMPNLLTLLAKYYISGCEN